MFEAAYIRLSFISVLLIAVLYNYLHINRTIKSIKLSNGVSIPLVGLGTAAQLHYEPIHHALTKSEYKLIDTASMKAPWYKNEQIIGDILRNSNLNRQDYFISTKLYTDDHGFNETLQAVKDSLQNLQLDYLDLYLIHFPHCTTNVQCGGTWRESWRAMELLYDKKIIRAIGVSNFSLKELQELVAMARIKPHVIQNYFDPFNQDMPLIEYCQTQDIFFQGYSTLGGQYWQQKSNPVLSHPTIKAITQKYPLKTSAQVVLRWAVQKRIGVLPRSKKLKRIQENIEIHDFELTSQEMHQIDSLNTH